jgi:hypothetical protein
MKGIRNHPRRLLSAVGVLMMSFGLNGVTHAGDTSPAVSGPVTGGNGTPVLFSHAAFDLASVEYTQAEFFVAGTANAFAPAATLTPDGKWTVQPASQAAYTTRVVIERPVQGRKFNGTVLVEWLNVTGGVDATPAWTFVHDELIRRGYAYVAVSAQFIGVNQLKSSGLPAPGDPARYAALVHPGDSYSYDIFSQVGRAIRDNADVLLGGLRPQRVIAMGESQSAARLVTYLNAAHPRAGVYDGFLVGSRLTAGSPLSQPPLAAVPVPAPTFIRDDLSTPVLVLNSETDVGALQARQVDTSVYRLWEVAGTAHFDLYGLSLGAFDTGTRNSVRDAFDSMLDPPQSPSPAASCPLPVNTGLRSFVQRAALAHLNRWVAFGSPPPMAPRLETLSIVPAQYALDANGNVLGGVRTPAVDAPVAKLSGLGQTGVGAQFCFLFGTTAPFPLDQLTALYRNHGQFVRAWNRATLDAVKEGFVLLEDGIDLAVVAAQSNVLR